MTNYRDLDIFLAPETNLDTHPIFLLPWLTFIVCLVMFRFIFDIILFSILKYKHDIDV
jgi:hypothetical protein